MHKLTPKQKAFVNAYCGNGAAAAVKAGYAPKSARITAAQLLTNPNIRAAIEARTDKATQKLIADREARQQFWTEVMQDDAAKMPDRLKASELLGKSEADFIDRQEQSGSVSVNININRRIVGAND